MQRKDTHRETGTSPNSRNRTKEVHFRVKRYSPEDAREDAIAGLSQGRRVACLRGAANAEGHQAKDVGRKHLGKWCQEHGVAARGAQQAVDAMILISWSFHMEASENCERRQSIV